MSTAFNRENMQRLLGHIVLLPMGAVMIFILRCIAYFRIREIDSVREQYKQVAERVEKDGRPLLICSNHLTLVDSIILHWALAPLWWYFFNYRFFSWNLPAIETVKKKVSWQIVTFLTKCKWIERHGTPEETQQMLDEVIGCLRQGEAVTIFPEGTRSRTGRVEVDQVTYGVGKMLQSLPDCLVLCIYLRGNGQESYSDFPRKTEEFYLKMSLIEPKTEKTGLRGIKDLSTQVISHIKKMEDDYFRQ